MTAGKAIHTFFSFINLINEVVGKVCSFVIVLASLILVYEVLVRYFLRIPTIWEIEAAIYLTMMATYVGAGYGLKHRVHITVDILTARLSESANRKISIIVSILSIVVCIILAWRGWDWCIRAYNEGWRSYGLWAPPLWIPLSFLPIGMTLLILQYILYVVELLYPSYFRK
ncbi:MAG: TRAP transporter small permease subunit [Nitrososphaerales archaeon]|nr:TRAP transporter small permease subunit [Nitrososphaerales archaeon]